MTADERLSGPAKRFTDRRVQLTCLGVMLVPVNNVLNATVLGPEALWVVGALVLIGVALVWIGTTVEFTRTHLTFGPRQVRWSEIAAVTVRTTWVTRHPIRVSTLGGDVLQLPWFFLTRPGFVEAFNARSPVPLHVD